VDFTILGGVVGALLLAIPAVTAYYSRESRKQRAEIRKLRALVQEFDVHVFALERRGWTSRGEPAPRRPRALRAVHDDEPDEVEPGAPPGPGTEGGPDAVGGARHAAGGP